MSAKCSGIMGRIFGHKFYPVITKGPADKSLLEELSGSRAFIMEIIDSTRERTFHGCVCERCGAKEPQEQEAQP